jgi:hypothetical protein
MRAWYDIRALAGVRREDEAGVRQSARQIESLIARERQRGIRPSASCWPASPRAGRWRCTPGCGTPSDSRA